MRRFGYENADTLRLGCHANVIIDPLKLYPRPLERRKEFYDRVQELMFDYQPLVELVSPHILVGAHPEVGNFRPAIIEPYTMWNADELFIDRDQDR